MYSEGIAGERSFALPFYSWKTEAQEGCVLLPPSPAAGTSGSRRRPRDSSRVQPGLREFFSRFYLLNHSRQQVAAAAFIVKDTEYMTLSVHDVTSSRPPS